ncbi:DUF397 domain-containing protein [Streptomyces sp. NPDC088846]|uniref:DUF397 domain-containing protein n=1 Tax=Streptomyces sp. NPDC088846 TaxID=3365908 RepID=UPI0038027A03
MSDQPHSKWFKSSYSGSPNNECVECANMLHSVLVRDSKDADGPNLGFSKGAWQDFTGAVRTNSFVRR